MFGGGALLNKYPLLVTTNIVVANIAVTTNIVVTNIVVTKFANICTHSSVATNMANIRHIRLVCKRIVHLSHVVSWTWWGTARWHEDIWSGCVYRDIAASGRAGWPTAPCRAAEVAMSKPFRACGAGWAKPTPCCPTTPQSTAVVKI